jgi:hypothetical protein
MWSSQSLYSPSIDTKKRRVVELLFGDPVRYPPSEVADDDGQKLTPQQLGLLSQKQ